MRPFAGFRGGVVDEADASWYPYGRRPPMYRLCSRVWVAIAVRTRILMRVISR